jgi:hypothetical protein
VLDAIENKLTNALDKVNTKVQDEEQSQRIEEKQSLTSNYDRMSFERLLSRTLSYTHSP